VFQITDEAAGLDAWIAVDEAVDGLTVAPLDVAAIAEADETKAAAKRWAHAWTWACRTAELDAGGGQVLVRDTEDLDEPAAYRALARALDQVDPELLCLASEETLGDPADASERLNPSGTVPTRARAVGLLSGIQAVLWALDGDPRGEGNRILFQGYGPVAGYVAQGMSEEGAMVQVAAEGEAREQAERAGHATIDADAWREADCDVLVPAGANETLTAEAADELEARGVCPAVIAPLASRKAGEVLAERGIQHALAPLVNAGGFVEAVLTWREGDAQRIQDEIDRRLSQVYDLTRRVLADAADEGVPPDQLVARRWDEV
jgi:glutamate dehydrogenase/leucine dehydrogenase